MSHGVTKQDPMQSHPLDVTVVSGQNSTVATLAWFDGEHLVYASGEAKRMPGDMTNDAVGINLAVGRALERLGQHLSRKAIKESMTDH